MYARLIALIFFLSFLTCQQPQPTENEPPQTFSFDFEAIANKLVERANLQAGEKVLLVGLPGDFDALILLLKEKITASGAEDLGALSVGEIQPENWGTDFTKGTLGKNQAALLEYFQEVDLGIMLPGATPNDAAYAALQDLLRQEKGRTIHFHWAGAYDLNGQELARDDTIDAFYQRVLLETDYEALAAAQLSFEAAMRGQIVQVTTPAGTDISFEIGDRPVTKQDGDASAARAAKGLNLIDREVELPAGAIRVAPMEETVNGKIAFPRMQWNGQWVDDLIMTFEAGKLVDLTATTNQEAVEAEIGTAGEGAKSFREFALGFNPMLVIQREGKVWMPYYGYGAGVVRLSLGDNTELGGNVGGGYVRWNFFPDASVKVGNDVWVKDGELRVPKL